MRVDIDAPSIGQRASGTGVVEVAMREHDRAWPAAAAETAFGGTLNSTYASGLATIDQNPRCRVADQIGIRDQRGNDGDIGRDFPHASSCNVID
jgi:hypothetical protein